MIISKSLFTNLLFGSLMFLETSPLQPLVGWLDAGLPCLTQLPFSQIQVSSLELKRIITNIPINNITSNKR
ncbi:MAG: hypothetical protein PHY32_02055 [Candidatus Pacebacteria bacterium]|jgi:hypothetical protein|nr:hypothetical protein [Candidatus Paceibacterota bacterium]